MTRRYITDCGCPFDDTGRLVDLCGVHRRRWSSFPQPVGVALLPAHAPTEHAKSRLAILAASFASATAEAWAQNLRGFMAGDLA